MTDNETPKPASKSRRGFASMTPATRSAIASKGGKAAHAAGTAHEWSRESASAAGRKGGLASSNSREHMSEIGRRGGLKRAQNRAANESQRRAGLPSGDANDV